MTTPIEVPAEFSETLEKNLDAIQEHYLEHGTITLADITWLITNTRNLDTIMHATANFANIADETVNGLQAKLDAKDDAIADLTDIIDSRDREIDALSRELSEANADA